jgi:penicillin-binding protein 2
MKHLASAYRQFSPRLGWLLLGLVFLFIIIMARLVEIQLFKGEVFLDLANENRYFKVSIPPQRGVFFDRYQQPLVWNKRTYLEVEDPLAAYTQTSSISREQALKSMATQSAKVRYGLERYYRFPESVAHILGYVGPVTTDDLVKDSSLKVSDILGKIGLERVFDQQLQGQEGSELYEIDALGKRQRLISKQTGQVGQNISTAIDPYLSQVALAAFKEQIGAAVIMNVNTGEVLTAISSPSFDANTLSLRFNDVVLEKQRQQQLQTLLTDPAQIFFNRAVSGAYPPGSVFKLVTALGGLESRKIDATTTVLDEGALKVGEYEYANWYFTQFGKTEGEISLQRALARSNDIYFYKVAEWLGPNQLAEFARLLGLGKATGIELGGETTGTVPDPSWKEQVVGEPWYLGNTYHMGIGQGDILVSPLQIAQMTQAVANHGTLCQPTLLKENHGDCGELGLAEEHLELVLAGMLDACSAKGTAYPFFVYNESYRDEELDADQQIKNGAIACKTGTAEFGGVDEQGYRQTHGWLSAVIGTAEIKKLATQVAQGDQELITQLKEKQNLTQEEDLEQGDRPDHLAWLKKIDEHNFPDKLVITVLIESDEDNLFKEGSRDVGPVVKEIVDWMYGK